MTRSEKLLVNSATGLVLEIATCVSSIVIIKLIISSYGSDVNGLVTSITQFLAYLTLLESGVGGVVKAALYKPLGDNDRFGMSRVVKSSNNFFKKLAVITVGYIVTLCLIFPVITNVGFETSYVVSLVLIVGMTNIAQYFFGITYLFVLRADQRVYIYNVIQIITIFLNFLITYAFILFGASIQVTKFASGLLFVIRPIIINVYVKKHYKIISNVEPDDSTIKQRWYGVGFSVASFVHKKADIFILTLCATMSDVSVYAVYSSVLNGINSLISSLTNSFQATFGNMIAKNEKVNLRKSFNIYILVSNVLVISIFSVAMVQIIPFIKIYTSGITDYKYIFPLFATIIVLAEMVFCLRQPYQALITAAGHYKQTSTGAFIEAIINIILSLALIKPLGITGLAIGTFVAMVYRTVDYVLYLRKNIIKIRLSDYFFRNLISAVTFCLIVRVCSLFSLSNDTWYGWVLDSVIYSLISIVITLFVNYIVYRQNFLDALIVIRSIIKRRRKKWKTR